MSVKNEPIETVTETKLLGTIITQDLKWDRNTAEIVRKAYKRMQILNRAASFTSNIQDLRCIYLTYVRSLLDQSAVVWHSSLTKRNRRDLERVQKTAVKMIMGKKFSNYKIDLKKLNLDSLNDRREKLCLKFAKRCLKNEKVKNLFPLNITKNQIKTRGRKKYLEKKINTERYRKSAIPYMKDLLNKEESKKRKMANDLLF